MARGSKTKSRPRAPQPAPAPAEPAPAPAIEPQRPDPRRKIYAVLDLVFAAAQAFLIWMVIPNRLPSASFHLWTLPLFTFALGVAMVIPQQRAWLAAVLAGSAVLLSTILLIVRIVVSAAFLSGVYGAFGKAAAMTAVMSMALIVEFVALLPIVQVKYLMTRAGRRAFGVSR